MKRVSKSNKTRRPIPASKRIVPARLIQSRIAKVFPSNYGQDDLALIASIVGGSHPGPLSTEERRRLCDFVFEVRLKIVLAQSAATHPTGKPLELRNGEIAQCYLIRRELGEKAVVAKMETARIWEIKAPVVSKAVSQYRKWAAAGIDRYAKAAGSEPRKKILKGLLAGLESEQKWPVENPHEEIST